MIALNIVYFPALVFSLHKISSGWQWWYRLWRNDLIRFGGWFTVRHWAKEFKRDAFILKLQQAKQHLRMYQFTR